MRNLGKRRKSKQYKKWYGEPYKPKTLVAVKVCKRCGREVFGTQKCVHCGGSVRKVYRPVERVREVS